MRFPDAVVVALAVLAVATTAGTASAAGNTPPLADAGLDQRVTPNTTVYLDANESRDPDGEIARVEWVIETPAGDTTSPDCDSCRQTEFDVDDTGQYNVTLSVTDDDGATRSDTLYVTVAAGEGPSVTLTGPAVTSRTSGTEFTATIESDDADLQSLAWVVDGDVVDQRELDGTNATVSNSHSFDDTGDASVRAVAHDTLGHRGADEHSVTVGTPANGGGGSLAGCDDGQMMFDENNNFDGCYDGEDRLLSADGETYLQDVNGEEGIQLYDDDGNLVDVGSIQDNDNIKSNGKIVGGYNSGDNLAAHLAAGNDEVSNPNVEPEDNNDGGRGGSSVSYSTSRGSDQRGESESSYDTTSSSQCYTCDGSGTTTTEDADSDRGLQNKADDASDDSGSGGNYDSDSGAQCYTCGGDGGDSDDSDDGGGLGGYLSGLI